MGTKEEGAPVRTFVGYFGQLRPNMGLGTCHKCNGPVYVDSVAITAKTFSTVRYLHFSCVERPLTGNARIKL